MKSRRNHRRRMSVRFHSDEIADRPAQKRADREIARVDAILDSISTDTLSSERSASR